MPCYAAMTDKALVFSPDTEVETALKEMKKKKVDCAAIVGADGTLEGVFSFQILMKNLLPVSVAMAGGLQLDVTVRAAPGIAKRLRKVYPLMVSELMDRKFHFVMPQTPIWEGVSVLVQHGGPLFVVEGENYKFLGMITESSLLDELQRMQESEF